MTGPASGWSSLDGAVVAAVVAVVAPIFRSRRSLRVSMIDQYARGMAAAQANARTARPSAVAEVVARLRG